MTVKELSRLYWLNREIELNQQQIENLRHEWGRAASKMTELRGKMEVGMLASPVISDMPKAPAAGNKVESAVVQVISCEETMKRTSEAIDRIEALISSRQERCLAERVRLEAYIDGIDDAFLRQVFTLRFVNGLTWGQVAASIGGGNKAESVRRACYRFLKQRSEQ